MSERRTFRLSDEKLRQWVASFIATAPLGCFVEVRPATRSLEQNRLLHAALTDIAEQVEWRGNRFDVDVWKRLCTAACLREGGGSPELIPALDGKGVDIIYEHTARMSKAQMTDLIEWVFKFGAENGVTFKEPAPVKAAR